MNDNIILDDLIGKVPDDAWVERDEVKEYLVASVEVDAEKMLDKERNKHERKTKTHTAHKLL